MMDLITESTGWKGILNISQQEEEEAAKSFEEAIIQSFESQDDKVEVAEEPGVFHEVLHFHQLSRGNAMDSPTRWSRLRSIWKILGMEKDWTDQEILVFLFACLGYVWKSDVEHSFVRNQESNTSGRGKGSHLHDDLIDCKDIFYDDIGSCILTVGQRKLRRELVCFVWFSLAIHPVNLLSRKQASSATIQGWEKKISAIVEAHKVTIPSAIELPFLSHFILHPQVPFKSMCAFGNSQPEDHECIFRKSHFAYHRFSA